MKAFASPLCLLPLLLATPFFAQTPPQAAATTPAMTPPAPAAPAAVQPADAPATPAPPSIGNKVLPPADRSTPVGATISGLLDASHAVTAIQRQELEGRAALVTDITERVSSADKQLAGARQKANVGDLDAEAKAGLQKAWTEYDKMKAKLDKDLQGLRSADQPHWDRARSELAADYAFYAAAVASVEVATPE